MRDMSAYREVAVESWRDPYSGQIRIRPIAGQAFSPSMRVQCSRALSDPQRYPVGTRFLMSAKLTDRLGGEPFLYAWHGDPVVVLSAAEARRFIEDFRRRRI
jgi:hypothetical protein